MFQTMLFLTETTRTIAALEQISLAVLVLVEQRIKMQIYVCPILQSDIPQFEMGVMTPTILSKNQPQRK